MWNELTKCFRENRKRRVLKEICYGFIIFCYFLIKHKTSTLAQTLMESTHPQCEFALGQDFDLGDGGHMHTAVFLARSGHQGLDVGAIVVFVGRSSLQVEFARVWGS